MNAKKQLGFTLIELVIVFAIIGVLMFAMAPLIMEPLHQAKIRGAVEQAKQIISTCDLARKKPLTAVRDPITLIVTTTYPSAVNNWTNISALDALFSGNHYLPPENPFGRPYYYKMSDKSCQVAVELDELIEGWEGYVTEDFGGRTRIIVGIPQTNNATTSWVKNQKRMLSGETSR